MKMQSVKRSRPALPAGVAALLGSAILAPGMAQAVTFEYSGYIREHLSVNLQNNEQFEPRRKGDVLGLTLYGEDFGGQGELSMWRHSGKLEATADFGAFQVAGVGRVVRETHTNYERGLQNTAKQTPAFVTTGLVGATFLNAVPGTTNSQGGPLMPGDTVFLNAGLLGYGGGTIDDLPLKDYDSTELRELYVTFDLGERTHFKLGKQQVVWGETDFFRALDIIHGYDLRWRSFLELENEELRKPLNLANVTIDVPELAGALQLIYRPGWDGEDDVGDDGAINGGRWAPSPWAGAGVVSSLIGRLNRHHKYGDENDANYGFRWSGTFKQVGYSFAYYRGISNDAITNYNSILSPGGSNWLWDPKDNGLPNPFLPLQNQAFVELFNPKVETYGFTFNAYSGPIDAVLRGELAFTPNKPYNTGTNTFIDLLGAVEALGRNGAPVALYGILNDPNAPGSAWSPGHTCTKGTSPALLLQYNCFAFGSRPVGFAMDVPGLGPVVEKDTLKIMLGVDKQLNWTMNALKTSRPAFWTMQLFDTWVLNYDRDDDIVENFAFGAARREHQTFLTNAFSFPYRYDTITPGVAFGFDLGSFDSFLLPSLDIAMGDHWRLRFEADLFFPTHVEETNLGYVDTKTRLLGTLHNRDQFVARITYQF